MELKDQIKEIISEIEKGGGVKAVFGEPIKESGIVVVPVAAICLAGGGGGGTQNGDGEAQSPKSKGKGFGLGYKKMARPVGYIKIADGKVGFEPIADLQKIILSGLAIFGVGAVLALKVMLKMKIRKMRWERQAAANA